LKPPVSEDPRIQDSDCILFESKPDFTRESKPDRYFESMPELDYICELKPRRYFVFPILILGNFRLTAATTAACSAFPELLAKASRAWAASGIGYFLAPFSTKLDFGSFFLAAAVSLAIADYSPYLSEVTPNRSRRSAKPAKRHRVARGGQ
jgi:hypothetical protein